MAVFAIGDHEFISRNGHLIEVEIVGVGVAGECCRRPGEPLYTVRFPSGTVTQVVESYWTDRERLWPETALALFKQKTGSQILGNTPT